MSTVTQMGPDGKLDEATARIVAKWRDGAIADEDIFMGASPEA